MRNRCLWAWLPGLPRGRVCALGPCGLVRTRALARVRVIIVSFFHGWKPNFFCFLRWSLWTFRFVIVLGLQRRPPSALRRAVAPWSQSQPSPVSLVRGRPRAHPTCAPGQAWTRSARWEGAAPLRPAPLPPRGLRRISKDFLPSQLMPQGKAFPQNRIVVFAR